MSTYLQKRMDFINAGRPLPPKKTYTINKVAPKTAAKIAAQKEVTPVSPVDKWFDDIKAKHCTNGFTFCMECNTIVPEEFMRHATAHLLPKKLFQSVATHPLNYLVLGAGCGCHEKSHRVDKFVKMKIWPEAARRIKELIPVLKFDELRHISDQLTQSLDQTA